MTDGELRRRLDDYENLLEIGVELAGTLDLARVFDLALEKAEELCEAETSSIWEVDEDRQELFFRVVRGRAAGEIRNLRVPFGEGIVGSVARSGEAEIVRDVASDPRWRGDHGSGFSTRAILAAPLLAHGRVIGVLQLLNPVDRSFSADDLKRVKLFAGSLAHALDNARLHAALKRQFLETVTALAEAVEKRDPYTGGHIRRVVGYSLLLARELDWSRNALEQLRLAAVLHDIGKIAVPDRVLGKQAPLDAEEARIMQRHPVDGAEIVGAIRDLRPLISGIRHHHERLDGRGYPDRLVDAEIPALARIIAVADSFDAMTSDRPYRRGLQPPAAAAEIEAGAGTQFCPEVAAAFSRLYSRGRFSVEEGELSVQALFADSGGS